MVAGSKKANKKAAANTTASSSNTSITATTEPSPPKTPPIGPNQIKAVEQETPSPAIPEEGIHMQNLNPASKYDTSFNNTPADTNDGVGYKVQAEGEGEEDSPVVVTSAISKTPQDTSQNLTTTTMEGQEEGEEEEEEEMLRRKLPVKNGIPPQVTKSELPLWLTSTIWIMIFPIALLWCFSVDLLRRILKGLF